MNNFILIIFTVYKSTVKFQELLYESNITSKLSCPTKQATAHPCPVILLNYKLLVLI